MKIKRRDLLTAGVSLGVGMAATGVMAQESPAAGGSRGGRVASPAVNSNTQPSSVDFNYKPRRINKAIELWEDGQPIYYGGSGMGPGVDNYAQGVKMARTYMDAINCEMEHGALDFAGLREFMRGLVDGGPTRSGHRTPAVFVETAIIGLDAAYMRANTWVLEQLLDCGVHGIHMCHARDADAVQVATQMAMRYPFDYPGVPKLPMRGLRGSSANFAAGVWGVNHNKYLHVADLWPLNPNVDKTIALPGISMAEWGPGDHSFWLYGLSIFPEDGSQVDVSTRPEMVKVRQAVLDACKKNKVMFLNAGSAVQNSPDYVVKQIQDGAMVLEAPESAAIVGREYSKRKMPV
jgi:4-hydroxy-2-oxoheptanedioate aldolase